MCRSIIAKLFCAVLLLLSAAGLASPPQPETIATFSIVGFDPETEELGVAVQSKFFAVGSVVPYAEAGVGAIASQAFGNTTFGPRGLKLLKEDMSVEETMDLLLSSDQQREQRQVGIVDAEGKSITYTGKECMAWAGGVSGNNFTAQGNILTGQDVVENMAKAFQETDGMLGEKLMRALEEGQKAGGDSRGMQSAAILIVKKDGGYAGYNDRFCDLRVDDHKEPIVELRRIFSLWKVNALIQEGYRLCDKGEWERAEKAGKEATVLAPQDAQTHYHLGCYLGKQGKKAESLASLKRALDLDPVLAKQAAADPDYKAFYEDAEFKKLVGESK